MLGGLLLMGGLGVLCGAGLAVASKIFYVYVDPKVEAVSEALPGANCGGCGYPGCGANAAAIVAGESSPSSCVAGGEDLAQEIARILGVSVTAREPDLAKPGCTYGWDKADLKYLYDGIQDCRAAVLLNGGSKICPVGCLGLGTCVRACPFNALSMGEDHLPVVDPTRCTGCGTCERVCPKGIITLSSNTRRILHEYTTDECTAPCQRACPAGIDIPVYIRQIRDGEYLEAVRTIKKTNPFPAVCGRICVHPCEFECRRNLVDEPVAINHLKRFASDFERASGERVHVPRAPETGHRVAVVGGGAEGLTAAYLINRLGHDAAIFESKEVLGGLLRVGLPENRLPRDVLDWEIAGILDAGIPSYTGRRLGADFSVASLLAEGYEAVVIATGGWDTQLTERRQETPLRPLPGVRLLIDLALRAQTAEALECGDHVMILGGGRAAIQTAIQCKKQGADEVYIVVRTTQENTHYPADLLAKAREQGVRFYHGSALTRMIGEGDRLTQAEIAPNIDNTEGGEPILLQIDTIIVGAGRFPELIYIEQPSEGEGPSSASSKITWETVFPYASPFAKEDIGIFRPGEVMSDYKAVVEAIGAGRRAASSLHRFLNSEPVTAPTHMIRQNTRVLSLDKLEPVSSAPREKMPERPAQELVNDPTAEIALGFSEEQARREAGRCLQCGLICYRRVASESSR